MQLYHLIYGNMSIIRVNIKMGYSTDLGIITILIKYNILVNGKMVNDTVKEVVSKSMRGMLGKWIPNILVNGRTIKNMVTEIGEVFFKRIIHMLVNIRMIDGMVSELALLKMTNM